MDLAGEFTEALTLLCRKFNKAFKKFDRRARPNVNDKLSDNIKKFENPRMQAFKAGLKMMKYQISSKGFNVMSVKGMDISNLNAQPFSRSRRRA